MTGRYIDGFNMALITVTKLDEISYSPDVCLKWAWANWFVETGYNDLCSGMDLSVQKNEWFDSKGDSGRTPELN